jgi:photosynthetic reaction center cytochrome c subunit
VYQNVKVLGDLSVGEFTRLMVAMTAWVRPPRAAPTATPANLADDAQVHQGGRAPHARDDAARINADWKTHVAGTGVTCYTCHRGKPVPPTCGCAGADSQAGRLMAGNDAGQNKAGRLGARVAALRPVHAVPAAGQPTSA